MATQIKIFGMSQMTIGSCSDFHSKVLGFITTATPAALHIEGKAAAYTAAVGGLASIVNRQQAFVATASMKEADGKRDNAAGVISSVTNAYLSSPVTNKSEAAHLLTPQLSPYKGIRAHEYTKQTAEVKGLLALLEQTDNKAAIATLGLTDEVTALRTANAAFEQAFLAKATEMNSHMTQSEIDSKSIIAEANTLYADIVQTVNAYAIVQPSDVINTFIGNLNGLVGAYSLIAGSSNTGGTASGGGTVTPPTGDDDKPDSI